MTIQGPNDANAVNVALAPGTTSTPISVFTINKDTNSEYYFENTNNLSLAPTNGQYNTEFEGFTSLVTTKLYSVTAGQTYHIKFAIADCADGFLDSIVWSY